MAGRSERELRLGAGKGGRGGGGGGVVYGAFGQLKGPLGSQRATGGESLAIGEKISLLERKFCPTTAFILQNKKKSKINKIK